MTDRTPLPSPDTAKPILRAPPLRQRIVKLGILFGIAGVAIAVAEFRFFPWLREYLAVTDAGELHSRLRIVFAGLSLSILAAAAWAFHLGMRVLKIGQWPLPGAFVLRDTPVSTGRRARIMAWAMIVWAVCVAALGVFAALLPDMIHRG